LATNDDVVAHVINQTQSGFDVVVNPRLAASTLAAGTFDARITA
jgi:hypothetical protein